MDDIIYYKEPQENEDEHIQIEYSLEFYATAKELSDYIHSLPIGQPENDYLIQLILNHVTTAAQNTFDQAFRMGVEFQKYTDKNK